MNDESNKSPEVGTVSSSTVSATNVVSAPSTTGAVSTPSNANITSATSAVSAPSNANITSATSAVSAPSTINTTNTASAVSSPSVTSTPSVASAQSTPNTTNIQSTSSAVPTVTTTNSATVNESKVQATTDKPVVESQSDSVETKGMEEIVAAPGVINPDSIPENTSPAVIDPSAPVINPNVISPDNSVVNTEKVKEPSSKILFVFMFIIIGFVFFMDDITDLFTEDNFVFRNGGSTANITSSNLVNGYIEIGSQNSFIKINDVKFYNFKKDTEGVITFDYTSESNIKNSKELDIYIVIYDGSGTVVYKELFSVNGKINKDDVKQYSMKVDNNVYIDAHFAKAVIFSEKEKTMVSTVTCTYEKTEEDVSVNYEVVYSFKNNDLDNYKVTKQITSKVNEGDIYAKYNNELTLEKQEISKFKANITEDVNYLSYTVDLTAIENKDITLYYKQGTLPYTINYKESLKNWTCKNG